MPAMFAELIAAARHLARHPGFTLVAVGILTLALGGTIAVFSVLDAVVLRPLPYAAPDRLVRIGHQHAERGPVFGAWSPPDYDDLVARARALERSAAYLHQPGQTAINSRAGDRPVQLDAAMVSPEFFATLGVAAARGRTLAAGDTTPGADRVVVLSDGAWRDLFGADPDILERDIPVNGTPYRVVGVMPPSFAYPSAQVRVWLPWSYITEDMIPRRREVRWLDVIARLAPGVSTAAAHAELDAVVAGLAVEHPASHARWSKVALQPIAETVGGSTRGPTVAVFAATVLVLLTACVNLAGLMLARAARREREFAVKGAIGGSPARLARLQFAEALLLAGAGAVGGLMLARAAIETFLRLSGDAATGFTAVGIDARVAAFSVAAAVVTALAVAAVPARRAGRVDPLRALARGAGDAPSRTTFRGALVVLQLALVCALGYAAALAIDGLRRLAATDLGLATDEAVLSFRLRLNGGRYEEDGGIARGRDAVLAAVRGVPGVIAAGASKQATLGESGEGYGFTLAGRPEIEIPPEWGVIFVTDDWFRTLGVPVLRGREFTAADGRAGAAPTVLVNQAFADRWFDGGDPVGRRLELGTQPIEIVGLVGDVRHLGPATPAKPVVYAPSALFPRSSVVVAVRAAGRDPALPDRLREAVWSVDPELPVDGMQWIDATAHRFVARSQLVGTLLAGFAALAALIGALGIYSALSQVVATQRRHHAIRLALGARPLQIAGRVLAGGAGLALLGAAIGSVLAIASGRALGGLLTEVVPADGRLLAVIVAATVALGIVASLAPMRRALRTAPMAVLREE